MYSDEYSQALRLSGDSALSGGLLGSTSLRPLPELTADSVLGAPPLTTIIDEARFRPAVSSTSSFRRQTDLEDSLSNELCFLVLRLHEGEIFHA